MRRRTMLGSRWGFDPFRETMRLHDNIDRMFNELMSTSVPRLTGGGEEGCFEPATDLVETDTNYMVTVDLPGVSKEDVKVELKDNRLYISGERKETAKTENAYELRTEREYGAFEKVIDLPGDIDTDKVEASCENGVCQISIAKAAAAKPRLIPVHEGGFKAIEHEKETTKEEKKAA